MSTISNVTRYRAGLDEDGIVCHREKEDGRWVKYEDYEQLEKELLALRKERERAEPVAYMIGGHYLMHANDPKVDNYSSAVPLYTAPPAPAVVDDSLTAALCPSCHERIDNGKDLSREERRSEMDRAIVLTLQKLTREGRVTVR
ncbi:hypothetical protein WKN98_001627 [Escherichia coli]